MSMWKMEADSYNIVSELYCGCATVTSNTFTMQETKEPRTKEAPTAMLVDGSIPSVTNLFLADSGVPQPSSAAKG